MHSDSARRVRCWRFPSAAALLLWASFGSAVPSAPGAPPAIHVDDPWIRWLPAGVPAAGYLTLVNAGDRSLALIAAESADFGSVTIHRSVAREGITRMEEVKEIAVGPHSRLDFGEQVPITLHFRDGTSLTIPFEVRKPEAGA
jgi:copper(I)-binding protein